MLPDASIARADVSKAKPQHATRPTIGAHARRSAAAQGGRQAAAAARHTARVGRLIRSCRYQIELRGDDGADARGEGGPRAGGGGELGRRCASGRGGASGRGATSGRCTLVRGGRRRDRVRRRRETAMRACRGGASRQGGAARQRRAVRRRVASRRGGARRGLARCGEVAATTRRKRGERRRFWGEQLSVDWKATRII
jgi:hypothetical protein